MYSVVIIEDEYWTLRGILETFPWKDYGMEVINSFTESAVAFDYILQNQPNIVITDIEMPDMDGITIIKKLRERKVKSKFLVLSAHSSFAYAQELIKLGIFEYCLKPVSRQDAQSILKRLKASLDLKSEIVIDSDLPENQLSNSRFRKIVAYINEHYAEKITLNDLCATYNINPDYCNRLFLNHFGCSYSSYLKNIRMEKACYLLRQNESIPDVAVQTGYNDYYYFIKAFKKHFGVTPYQYKNNN